LEISWLKHGMTKNAFEKRVHDARADTLGGSRHDGGLALAAHGCFSRKRIVAQA